MMHKISKYWPLVFIIGLSFLVTWPLFKPGYFSHHDDLQVMRIFEMRRCLSDLQIPCRWVPDMGYGNGFPLFNYYSPLPYFLGAVFSYAVGYVNSAKILFFIPLLLGGISMYFLGRELFGKNGELVAGTLFLFAPYRALDSYVRGAVAESFALSLIPLVFYFSLRLIRKGRKTDFVGTVLSLLFFLLSHNIMTVIFLPFLLVWLLLILFLEGRNNLKFLITALILGIGMAAFFLLPAYFEKELVQINSLTSGALDFRNNFISLSRLFTDRLWGYNGATKSLMSDLSFQIGWPHWWLVILALILVLSMIIKSRGRRFKECLLPFFLIATFVLAVFMIHNRSAFIWEKISLLAYVQFPWRFLAVGIFTTSLLGGYCVSFLKGKLSFFLTILIIFLAVVLNWKYFRPQTFYSEVNDSSKLSGVEWKNQQKGALLDYLPRTATEPREAAPSRPLVVSGEAEIDGFLKNSKSFSFSVISKSESKIDVPVFAFPGWTVKINGKISDYSVGDIGRIEIVLPSGNFMIEGVFGNTSIRTFSNIISLASFVLFAFFLRNFGIISQKRENN